MLECVINISEGRDLERVRSIAARAGSALLDVHSDPHHHRSVLTLVGEDAAQAVASAAVDELDLRDHDGAHPRLGVVDVVPFVALADATASEAMAARDRFAAWFAGTHHVPCFLYGPERTLPEVRRSAFRGLGPDAGPPAPHERAGATAVGQRGVLVAYNVWLHGGTIDAAREIAAAVRSTTIRALGLELGPRHQISMNLVDPLTEGPASAYDRVVAAALARDLHVAGAELVGLVPRAVLEAVPSRRHAELDLDEARTIEARLEAQGLR